MDFLVESPVKGYDVYYVCSRLCTKDPRLMAIFL